MSAAAAGAGSTVPAELRAALADLILADLSPADEPSGPGVAVAIGDFLNEWQTAPERSAHPTLPDDPWVTLTADGVCTLVAASDVDPEAGPAVPVPVAVVHLLDDHIGAARPDIVARMDSLQELVSYLFDLADHPEMLLGHLIRTHDQDAEDLLELAMELWPDRHRAFREEGGRLWASCFGD